MWNPFRKKPDTFLESLKHHIMHEPEPMHHTMRNIFLGVILLFLLGGILFPMFKKLSQTPTFHKPTNTISGEITDKEDSSVKPGEICIRHPDIFVFHYKLDEALKDTRPIELQMKAVHDLASKGAIILIDQKSFLSAMNRGCFVGNPIWIFSASDKVVNAFLAKIGEKNGISPFMETADTGSNVDWKSFSGYSIKEQDIDELATPDSLRETLKKYLEIESGGLFKNIP